jgi:hypothetical protein
MNKKSAGHKKAKNEIEKKRKFTLIEILIFLAIIAILGNFIYHIFQWREAFEGFKGLGLFGSIAVIVAVIVIRRWIDSL